VLHHLSLPNHSARGNFYSCALIAVRRDLRQRHPKYISLQRLSMFEQITACESMLATLEPTQQRLNAVERINMSTGGVHVYSTLYGPREDHGHKLNRRGPVLLLI
jgi:hypothetical protein